MVLLNGGVGITGRRLPLWERSTMSAGETTEKAEEVVEKDPLVMMATAARITMQPLPR